MRYVVTIISTYLIFVNFGSPPHYLTFKKYAKKCVNFLQNIQNWAKGANIGQNFAFSLQKSTPAWKKFTTVGREKYQLWLNTAVFDEDDDDKDDEDKDDDDKVDDDKDDDECEQP